MFGSRMLKIGGNKLCIFACQARFQKLEERKISKEKGTRGIHLWWFGLSTSWSLFLIQKTAILLS
jgi:hypothetical protein